MSGQREEYTDEEYSVRTRPNRFWRAFLTAPLPRQLPLLQKMKHGEWSLISNLKGKFRTTPLSIAATTVKSLEWRRDLF